MKTGTVQTNPVDFCLVEYMFNQLPMKSQLSTLSKLFSVYLSQFSLTVPNDFLDNVVGRIVLVITFSNCTLHHVSASLGV